MRITVLHPGRMGVRVAAALSTHHEVAWCAQDRSAATRERAADAGLEELGDLRAVVAWSQAVVSVCPPAAAERLADEVAAAGFTGLYLDANAVSPTTGLRIAAAIGGAGGTPVDGGIVGPPPREPGTTRLYVSGERAGEVADWFAGTSLGTMVLDGGIGAASALKASYAGWTKASAALLVAVRAHARAAGVEDALLEEWDRSQPGLRQRSDAALARLLDVAWRYEGELTQIASSMDDHGVPADFHDGAAAVYRRLTSISADPRDVAAVLDDFLRP